MASKRVSDVFEVGAVNRAMAPQANREATMRTAKRISRIFQLMRGSRREEDRMEWGVFLCGFTRTRRVRLRVPGNGIDTLLDLL